MQDFHIFHVIDCHFLVTESPEMLNVSRTVVALIVVVIGFVPCFRIAVTSVARSQDSTFNYAIGNRLQVGSPSDPSKEINEHCRNVEAVA